MKKFNFFPVLLVALFVVLGLTAQAQNYVPAQKAVSLVEVALVSLEKTQPSILMSSSASQTSLDASYVHALKISVGNDILEPLKSGNSVSTVLTSQFGRMSNINDALFRTALAEVELFYKNLLKIK